MRGEVLSCEPGEVEVGDLMVHPNTRIWTAVVESYPSGEPTTWVIELADATVWSLTRNQLIPVRRGWNEGVEERKGRHVFQIEGLPVRDYEVVQEAVRHLNDHRKGITMANPLLDDLIGALAELGDLIHQKGIRS